MKATKLLSILILLQFMLIGCSSSRFQKKGNIINTNYSVEIPFRYIQDMMLVDVVIEGTSYTFMWDTGAELNVIDQSIANQINATSIGNTRVKGSDNTSKKMGRVAIPSLTIGPLDVQGSVAVISDFTSISRFLGCLDIKGIIGNNVMRRANMQIDYKKNIITLSDSNLPFNYSNAAHIVKMNAGKIGNVKLKLIIDDEEQYLTFDTGYGGKIKSNKSSLLADHPNITSHGITGASLHQVNQGSNTDVLIKEGELAGISFNNQAIVINESGSSLVGNKFLNNFIISVHWNQDQLIFDPIKPMTADTLKPFEIKIIPNFNTLKIEIAKLYKDHTEFKEELIGWQVNKINSEIVENISLEQFCDYWDKISKELERLDEFEAEITKDEATRTIIVRRIDIDQNITE